MLLLEWMEIHSSDKNGGLYNCYIKQTKNRGTDLTRNDGERVQKSKAEIF